MATITTVVKPYTQTGELDVSAPITNRFPTPPIAWGFTVLVTDSEEELPWGIQGVETPYIIPTAFQNAGLYSEIRKGQIWPR